MTDFSHSLGAAANRRYAGQLDDFMKFRLSGLHLEVTLSGGG
jgi:hypothetical protein